MPDTIQLGSADRIFVLTGAGVSAESGIPTFRDSNGLWNGYRVEEVATPEGWLANAELVWNFYSMRRRDALRCEPNPAHWALAELEAKMGERFFLCTQNVDDLHERAGTRNPVHMHGELFSSRCELGCEEEPFADCSLYETAAQIPRCSCGARIRPNIVWFGEYPFEMERIEKEIDRCSVLVVVGSSGNVHPAASFAHWAGRRFPRPRTYYVGPERPSNAAAFTKVVLGKAGEVLPSLFSFA